MPIRTKGQYNRTGKLRIIEYKGRRLSVAEWAKELGMTKQGFHNRLKTLPKSIAFTRPLRDQQNLCRYCHKSGHKFVTCPDRARDGWPGT